jgi:hypothetical protein
MSAPRKKKNGAAIDRPAFFLKASDFEAWISSAHELLWNFSLRERALNSRASNRLVHL